MTPQPAARAVQLGLLARDIARSKRDAGAAKAHTHIVERLGKLHGLPQKVGQILSLRELDDEEPLYTPLTEAESSLPASTIHELIESELGQGIDSVFEWFEPEGISASLSQVHRARLHDGRDVAVKVQYPNIRDAVRTDLKALGWVSAPIGGFKRGFNLAAYQREVNRILDEELDYRHEARSIQAFHARFMDWNDVAVPEVVAELSSDRVLTMTWVGGGQPSATREWTSAQRHAAGCTLLKIFFWSCFRWRCLHGDPHPGNLRFELQAGQPIVGLLDFGCTRELEAEAGCALHALIDMTTAGTLGSDQDAVFGQYVRIGFDPELLVPMADALPELTRVILAPFAQSGPFDVSEWRFGERVQAVLGDHRWNFRMAGPAHLMVFLRAYQGLIQYLRSLGACINWSHVYERVPYETESPAPIPAPLRSDSLSKHLRIQVLESGRQKVALTFRAHTAAFLNELLPDDVGAKLAARGIDVGAIEREAETGRFAPGDLFSLTEGQKEIRVWLE